MPEILKSKRVWITAIGIIVLLAREIGVRFSAEFVDELTKLVMVLVASFGATGFGKEKLSWFPSAIRPTGPDAIDTKPEIPSKIAAAGQP